MTSHSRIKQSPMIIELTPRGLSRELRNKRLGNKTTRRIMRGVLKTLVVHLTRTENRRLLGLRNLRRCNRMGNKRARKLRVPGKRKSSDDP